MTWLRARVGALGGMICLLGQGILLSMLRPGGDAISHQGLALFLLLTCGWWLALWRAPEPVERWWRRLSLGAGVVLLATGLALWGVQRSEQPPVTQLTAELDRLSVMGPALQNWWTAVEPRLRADFADSMPPAVGVPTRGGDAFRSLASLPALWPPELAEYPLGLVFWRLGSRQAWAGVVEPLPRMEAATTEAWQRVVVRGRHGLLLRQSRRWGPDLTLEVQVRLSRGDEASDKMVVALAAGAAVDLAAGRVVRQVGLGPDGGKPLVALVGNAESAAARIRVRRGQLVLAIFGVWLVAALGFVYCVWGAGVCLVALWGARAVLAAGEVTQWVGTAFPRQAFPAAPQAWFSLIDPAYFATPFGHGWLASVADALLTTLVVVVAVGYMLRRRKFLVFTPVVRTGLVQSGLGWGLRGGFFFGLTVSGVLWALASMANLVAKNANPRLIGVGVNWGSLSFWGLHIVVMLWGLSLVALATSWLVGPRPARVVSRASWLSGGALASAVAAALTAVVGGRGLSAGVLLAAGVTAGLWCLGLAIQERPRAMRQGAWPLMLMLVVVWNYASLRAVYDQAERNWLVAKADRITAVDADWPRFLLGSVLSEMVAQDGRVPQGAAGPGLWRDEAAWRLYQQSSLRDLGHICTVELIDEIGNSASSYSRGFLRTKRFEIVERGPALDMSGRAWDAGAGVVFGTERRRYPGGEEQVLIGEAERANGRGWLRVELPLRSWRVRTLARVLDGDSGTALGAYRPRSEVDRPRLLLLGDDHGWRDTGAMGIPAPTSDRALAALRRGDRAWADITVDGVSWLCLWQALPENLARSAGEGFLVGLRRPVWQEDLLDLSRLMLLDLTLFFLGGLLWRVLDGIVFTSGRRASLWQPGFQERFLAASLALGLVLLVLVGTAVNRKSSQRVRTEARTRAGAGLVMAVEQLHTLLTEQAWSLVDSDYMDELMRGRLVGQRPAGSENIRQGMVFAASGELLLDETLSDLSAAEARTLLAAGRQSPLVMIREDEALYVGAVIPIDLGGWVAQADTASNGVGHSSVNTNGFFFYRQRLDKDLVNSLAELVGGQITLDVAGQPLLASHPTTIFSGQVPLLADPVEMMAVLDHAQGTSVFAAPSRRYAFTAGQPLASLNRDRNGVLVVEAIPAVLNLNFPDREREYVQRRHDTILYLAGMANLVLLTALALAWLVSWNIFRPLRLLLTATQLLGRGDFDAPLPAAGHDEVGFLAAAFGSMRADLKTARNDLAARERFLSTVLERVTVGVVVVDADDRIVALNPAGERILQDFMPEAEMARRVREVATRFREQEDGQNRGAGELVSADGLRTLRGAVAPLTIPGASSDTMLVIEDVTEFLAAKKMALNAELTRQVAHEIKNPLTPIKLSVQFLAQAARDGHPDLEGIVAETVARVLQQVALLRSIATEFSLLGRPGKLATEALDLAGAVADVVRAYTPPGEGDGTGVVVASEALPPVRAHGDSLHKILGNLMQNSLDAVAADQSLRVEVSWRIAPKTVTLVWRDHGVGLAPEVAARLFDPYFSTKSKGTGLGLVICRNLADRMGGDIHLRNCIEGPGVVAELTIPRAEPERDGKVT